LNWWRCSSNTTNWVRCVHVDASHALKVQSARDVAVHIEEKGGGHTSTGARDEAFNVVGVAATIRVAVVVARWEEAKKFCGGDVGQDLVVIELIADAGLVGS